MEKKPGMTARDIMEELGLSHPTVYALLKRPDCPAIRVGSKWVVPREAFYKWFNELAKDKAVL